MTITLTQLPAFNKLTGDTLIIPLFAKEVALPITLPKEIASVAAALIKAKSFTGSAMQTAVIPTAHPRIARVILVGMGDSKTVKTDLASRALGAAIMVAKKAKAKHTHIVLRTEMIDDENAAMIVRYTTIGIRRAAYHFTKYKTKKHDHPTLLKVDILLPYAPTPTLKKAVKAGEIIADAIDMTRDLGNSDAAEVTPEHMAETARRLAKEYGNLTVKSLDMKQLNAEGLGGIIAVGKGSQHEPRLVVIEYRGGAKNDQPIAFAGKGITFDTGGISIKPWEKLEEMKFDMLGGASVIALLTIAARLQLPVNVVGLVAAAENVPSHTAYKPGDIIRMGNGTTVEILSTDAEGRMVLGDAFYYATRYNPSTLIDLATLTGAVLVALGDYASGLMSNDETLSATLEKLGEETGDRVWRLPLPKEWNEKLKSPVADLRNIHLDRNAGSSMAGLFLQHFVPKKTAWAHLDIAGTAWRTGACAYEEHGATGASILLLVAYLEQLSEPRK